MFLGWTAGSTIFIQALYIIPTVCETCSYIQIEPGVLFTCQMPHHGWALPVKNLKSLQN